MQIQGTQDILNGPTGLNPNKNASNIFAFTQLQDDFWIIPKNAKFPKKLNSYGLGSSGRVLTPDIAIDLMHRSMTTGVPTSEFDAYGGYDVVASMYQSAGGGYNRAEIPKAEMQVYANQVAATGVGNLQILADTATPITTIALVDMVNNGIDTSTVKMAVENFGTDAMKAAPNEVVALVKDAAKSPEKITPLVNLIDQATSGEQIKKGVTKTDKTTAQNFHDYIYAGGNDATAATAKGLAWYDANRSVYTPDQFVALWNKSEGTSFTVTDLDNALLKYGYQPSMINLVALADKNTSATSSALPLILAAAAAYFFGT